jgi:hypothetical protein
LIIWSNVETAVGLICACLPTLKPVIPGFTSAVRTWISGSQPNSSYNSKRKSASNELRNQINYERETSEKDSMGITTYVTSGSDRLSPQESWSRLV